MIEITIPLQSRDEAVLVLGPAGLVEIPERDRVVLLRGELAAVCRGELAKLADVERGRGRARVAVGAEPVGSEGVHGDQPAPGALAGEAAF